MEKPICQKLQYLIGVPKKYIDNFEEFDKGVLSTIRKLCSLRSVIIEKFTDINNEFRNGVQLSEIGFTTKLISDLAQCDISIENRPSLSRNVIELNELIAEKVKPVSLGFYPIPEEWIQELFNMPAGDTIEGVKNATRKYRQFKNYYPYQKYINWPFESTSEERRSRSILRDDKSLHEMLSEIHFPKFISLMDFVGMAGDAVVVIDCENSDAQRLYDALDIVKLYVQKIILIDDTHTNRIWDEIVREYKEAGISIEHDEFPRLKEQKSLVDHRMVAKTCEEFYKNNIKHFVLVTSDSDVWALIHSLPDAEILVLAERCKSGDVFIDALTQNKTQRVFLEDITTESTELRDRIVHRAITAHLERTANSTENVWYIVKDVLQELQLYLDRTVFDEYVQWTQNEIACRQSKNAKQEEPNE